MYLEDGLFVFLALFYNFGYSQAVQDGLPVTVFPATQKVIEGSRVVFTCMSGNPNMELVWKKPSRPLDEETDDVTITQINAQTSVVEIERADIKKHKRKYRCYQGSSFAEVMLKVVPRSRVPKNFPYIVPSDDILVPTRDSGSVAMMCTSTVAQGTRDAPTWRWIKDGKFDLALTEDSKPERITIAEDGRLSISQLAETDTGTYMCVAENKRGTAYGSPFKLNVKVDKPAVDGECYRNDKEGETIKFGDSYNPNGDPCQTCTCIDNGRLSCRSVRCAAPQCSTGLWEASRDVCCQYTCVDKEGREVNTCKDRDGRDIQHGDSYMPTEDPCLECECNHGRQGRCKMVACAAPRCRGDFISSRDLCCDYTCTGATTPTPTTKNSNNNRNASNNYDISPPSGQCRDHRGLPVQNGQMYRRGSDPCEECLCNRGLEDRCIMMACDAPPCRNHRLIPDTCCGFVCLPDRPDTLEGECRDYKGVAVQAGQVYRRGANPCEECVCNGGFADNCVEMVCDEPPCRNHRLIPDTCCGFVCLPELPDTIEGSCIAHNGSLVENGDKYAPYSEPCKKCTCEMGVAVKCLYFDCKVPRMRCRKPFPIPGECCQFTCDETITKPKNISAIANITQDRILGRVFVQQIGPRDAIVQWKLPPSAAYRLTRDMVTNMSVYYYSNPEDMYAPTKVSTSSGADFFILHDLDPNVAYYVTVNGTSHDQSAILTTRAVKLVLDGRERPSFVVSGAMGQVFESQGAIQYDGYSIPRPFIAVSPQEMRTTINFNSFHRVEVTTYAENPCPNKDCGMLRFFMYSNQGEPLNVMSLMFADDMDFIWAKAHL